MLVRVNGALAQPSILIAQINKDAAQIPVAQNHARECGTDIRRCADCIGRKCLRVEEINNLRAQTVKLPEPGIERVSFLCNQFPGHVPRHHSAHFQQDQRAHAPTRKARLIIQIF